MDLPSYIDQVGIAHAAAQFGASARTIYSWRNGERRPRPDKANEIERVTKRKVTVAEIYPAQ